MMRLTEAAQALSARFTGGDVEFTAVNSDSRAIRRGDLFVALRGDRFDGHRFVAEAAAAGAAAALVDEAGAAGAPPDWRIPLVIVADTLKALGELSNYWRRRFAIPVIALTGSNGKTTVKEMLASILRESTGDARESRTASPPSSVLATRGNLNNHIGVPLTLLELRREHRYAVIEMGMNHTGEISYIARLAEPDFALINNAGVAHIENLGSTAAIARAKGEIFEGLKTGGTAVLNADDAGASLWRELAAGKRQVDFALEKSATVTATYKLREVDSEIVLKSAHGSTPARVPVPGLHNVRNALAASAAATALGVPLSTIAIGLAGFSGVKGRLQRKACVNGATLIDDTYNANPESVRAAIDVLAKARGKKLLVLGDMGELGPQASEMHAEIGAFAHDAGIDRLLTLGDLSSRAAQSFGNGARHFTRIEDLLGEVQSQLAADVTMLVKGSRFMQMERVVRNFELKHDEQGATH